MGFDQITWSPRRGATGDDQYDVPDDCGIGAGDASGFDATPTLAQIAASSGLNQIVGLANRRILQFKALFGGTSQVAIPYFVTGQRYFVTNGADPSWTLLINLINLIRSIEGFSVYGLVAPTAGHRILRTDILNLRKALRIGGILTRPGWCIPPGSLAPWPGDKHNGILRTDDPFGTPIAPTEYFTYSNIAAGNTSGGGTKRIRRRSLWSTAIPDWMTTGLVSAVVSLLSPTSYTSSGKGYSLWRSNTDDSAYVSTTVASNFDQQTAQVTSGTSPGTYFDFTLTNADVLAKAAARMSFILAMDDEESGVNITGNMNGVDVQRITKLTINFGT